MTDWFSCCRLNGRLCNHCYHNLHCLATSLVQTFAFARSELPTVSIHHQTRLLRRRSYVRPLTDLSPSPLPIYTCLLYRAIPVFPTNLLQSPLLIYCRLSNQPLHPSLSYQYFPRLPYQPTLSPQHSTISPNNSNVH